MPKEIKDINNQEVTQVENYEDRETESTSDYTISIDYSDNINKTEKKIKINEFIFYTPIHKAKKVLYIPTTPKKSKIGKEEELIKGKNLLLIFKSM